ncbi:MAG: hypothetical protein H7Y86_07460 [Rhizobacter sp.]|nr:hypothetical protein [Ferruginibacter sp.]
MKKIIALLVVVFSSSAAKVLAQEEAFKKAEISKRIEITGDINFAWKYLSDLSNLQNLVPSTIQQSISAGSGKGNTVTLNLTNNKGVIVEQVVELNKTSDIFLTK